MLASAYNPSRKQRQEGCHKFEATLVSIAIAKLDPATDRDPCQKHTDANTGQSEGCDRGGVYSRQPELIQQGDKAQLSLRDWEVTGFLLLFQTEGIGDQTAEAGRGEWEEGPQTASHSTFPSFVCVCSQSHHSLLSSSAHSPSTSLRLDSAASPFLQVASLPLGHSWRWRGYLFPVFFTSLGHTQSVKSSFVN